MRTLIVAALILSPIVLSAQANSPASTQAQNLEARLTQPVLAAATAHPAAAVRTSTGVVAPELIHTVDIEGDKRSIWAVAGVDRTVKVSMIVDEKGVPHDVKVLECADHQEDKNIVTAVSQYRFKPGTLSHQPFAIPLNLEIILAH